MNILKAVLLKLTSAFMFSVMSALVRYVSDVTPLGEVVFCRSFFAIIPVMLIYAWRGELAAAFRTARPFGHLGRGMISVAGMFFNFAALARLPIVDVTTITFASPLITVALSAWILKERVRIYRWTAVAVGFVGVVVMLWPHLDVTRYTGAAASAATLGALFAMVSAFTNAASVVQTRRLTDTETTSSIVLYFSLFCALGGLLTLPFGWIVPSWKQLAALVGLGVFGGLSHILLTESYRYAPASLVAPLDYTALFWAFILGYWFFGEIPTTTVYVGSAIVAGSGLFVIWRERQLGLERARARAAAGPPTGT
ncbi:MAG: DMT family transporter [Alphaproteobacteria bacterium]|nr:MAG: DMT family transporter [Alphaproteobacteria bacterium]